MAGLITQLVRHVASQRLTEARSLVMEIEDPEDRFRALLALARRTGSEPDQTDLYREAIAALRVMHDGYAKREAILGSAAQFPQPLIDEVLEIVVGADPVDYGGKGTAIAALLSSARPVPWTPQSPSQTSMRSLLTGLSRADTVILLRQATALIAEGGGDDAVLETAAAMLDVQRWWP